MKRVHFKSLHSAVFALCAVLFVSHFLSLDADARVAGRCKDCHYVRSGNSGAIDRYGTLPENDCLECHGHDPTGAGSIGTKGKTRFPQVIHLMQDNDLAAGNFYYVADGFNPDYSRGHNIVGISRPQDPPMNMPPGFMKNVLIPGGAGPAFWRDGRQMNCSGTWGCHGNRTIEDPHKAIAGAHHEDDDTIDGSTVGKSYRFLYGIKGKEHPAWEYLATPADHNGYKGSIDAGGMDTISYFCGECHAAFHPNPNLGGKDDAGRSDYRDARHRHPVDIGFNSVRGGFANSEYEGYVKYSLEVPVAFDEPAGGDDATGSGSVVMCLSCHRAHASPYPSILRWDYSEMTAGAGKPGAGCFMCHTKKVR
jgi:predicted CXXCH cytochrome family protein